MSKLDELLIYLIENHGSDLHLSTGAKPMIRKYGALESTDYEELQNNDLRAFLFEILTENQQRTFIEEKELDFAYEVKGVARFRVNFFDQRKGISAVFRLIPTELAPIKQIGLPDQVLEFTVLNRGLVLVTGPTGCGKSTTLSALINHINKHRRLHIITIEDPIEYVHENIQCLVNQRELESNTKSFSRAMRSALREDPDVILVGELRDLETIELAMTAAETGHLVFATLHTNSAAKTVHRIIDAFPAKQQAQIRTMLSGTLKGVMCQQLMKRADDTGVIPAVEILVCNNAIGNIIREDKIHQISSLMQAGKGQGMQLMDEAIMKLLKLGKISPKEAFLKANDKTPFEALINKNKLLKGNNIQSWQNIDFSHT
jgi:twitching motility protein PilT